MLYQLGSLVSLALLLAAIALAGRACERLLRLELSSARLSEIGARIDRWLLRVALGFGVWILALFALAALGLLAPPAIWLLAIVSALAGATALAVDSRKEIPTRSPPPSTADSTSELPLPRRFGPAILLVSLGVVGLALVVQALRPDVSWDANVYHLTLPRLFLEHGGFFRVPFNVYSNWPSGIELLFAASMGLRDYVLAKLLHFAFGALTAIVVYRLAGPKSGLLAVVLFLFNPVVLYEIRVAYVDLGYAFFLVLAAWSLSHALDLDLGSPRRWRSLLLCAVLAGALCAVKLNGFFGLLTLLGVWAFETLRGLKKGTQRTWLAELATLCAPSVLFGVPWVVKSWLLTGSPTYPLLFGVFGGPEWSANLAEQHATWLGSIGMGRELVDFLLLPLRVILFGDLGYATFDGEIHRAWILLLPIAVFGAFRCRMSARFLWVSGLYFLLWSATSQQMRLLIPILPLLAIAAARGLRELLDRLASRRSSRLAHSAGIAAAAACAVALLHASWIYLSQTPRLTEDLVTQGAELKEAVIDPVYRFIESELPVEARLLLINTNHGFFLERDYIADSFFEASQIAGVFGQADTDDEVRQVFGELRLTHALVENRLGPAYPDALVQVLQDPTLSEPLYRSTDGRFVVLAFR